MSDNSENEAIEENLEEVPLTKKKAKKPRTEAQLEAFEKVKEKRRQNLEAKKQEKILNSAKLLIEQETKKSQPSSIPLEDSVPRVKTQPKKKKIELEPEPESESESEEEIIIVKKPKPKPKKKKVRKIIIEESSSDEEDEEEEYYRQPMQSRRPIQIVRPNPNDFFC